MVTAIPKIALSPTFSTSLREFNYILKLWNDSKYRALYLNSWTTFRSQLPKAEFFSCASIFLNAVTNVQFVHFMSFRLIQNGSCPPLKLYKYMYFGPSKIFILSISLLLLLAHVFSTRSPRIALASFLFYSISKKPISNLL